MITQLEADVLECKVKWASGSVTTNKAHEGDGAPVELFQILKDDALKVLHSICQQIWKTQQWPQDWKRSVFVPISKKGQRMLKLPQNALISHISKVMFKSKTGFNSTWTMNFQMLKLDLEKAEEPEVKLPTSAGSSKNQKHLFLLYWLCQNLWLCGSQQTLENSSRDGNARPTDLPPEKSVCSSRSNS